MAKRVAAQRRGLLYGMIAAIFVAVIVAVFLIIQINENQNLRKLFDPKVVDTEGVQAELRDRQADLESIGVLPAGESMGLNDAIQRLVARSNQYKQAVGKLVYGIAAQPLPNVEGDALFNYARDIERRIMEETLPAAVAALKKAPQANVQGTEAQQPDCLTAAIRQLAGHVDALVADYKAKVDIIAQLQKDKLALEEQRETAKKDLDDAFKDLAKKKDDQIASLQKQNAEALEQVDKVTKEYEDARKAHNQYVNTVKEEKQKLVNQIIEKDAEIRILAVKIQRALAREFEPDGKILALEPGEDTGYINLGKGDGVFNGLTFSVFDPSELGKSPPRPKAAIRLTNVMDNASEFFITKLLRKNNPVVEGDIITNPAFDLERPFHFAIVGRFDINGDGVEDTDWVKSQIRRFGGKVQNTVTVETDYLVTGQEPMGTAGSGTGPATPQDEIRRKKIEQEQKEFGEATDMAARLHIPVLNQNRFLSLLGIAPVRTD